MADGPFVGPNQIHQPSGLTKTETEIMDHLIEAWNLFTELGDISPDQPDFIDFQRAIRQGMRILASRVVTRTFPNYWQ